MTSPPLTDQTPREDPTEGLRALVADLLALTGRLELKERIPDLQATLKAAQERVWGPRALVMLLSEHEELKRRFLERLLGPDLALIPNPTTECTRLEYGVEPEQTVTLPQGLATATTLDPLESFLNRSSISNAADSIPGAVAENIQENIPESMPEKSPETARQAIETIRLANPTLKGGLAVIDTPAVEGGEPSASVLACVEQADAWIFVLNADHALSEASQALLRRLPERGARLEMVVENAEALSGEERMAARDRLMQTLRDHCNIESPRLTLVASAATEGDEGSFWHGRFATFHSVMMLRGRERWLEGTLAMVLDALSKVGSEIDLELKSIALGVRHARLRLGMKDLDGLRARFYELSGKGELSARGQESEPAAEVKPVSPPPADAVPQQSRLDWSGGNDAATRAAAGSPSPLDLLAEAMAAIAPENTDAGASRPMAAGVHETQESAAAKIPERWAGESQSAVRENSAATDAPTTSAKRVIVEPVAEPLVQSASMPGTAFTRVKEKRPKRGVTVNLTGSLKQLVPQSRTAKPGRFTLLKRIAWVALLIAFVCLILWALAPRGFLFGHEPPAEWDFQQPTPALASHTAPAAPSAVVEPPHPGNTGSLPDTTDAATPSIPATPLAKHHGAVRTPLVHPIPEGAIAGVPQRKRHRHLLGLGKLWHWVRHPHHTKNDQATQ
jgi:hypothetical protein